MLNFVNGNLLMCEIAKEPPSAITSTTLQFGLAIDGRTVRSAANDQGGSVTRFPSQGLRRLSVEA
jgi:hypothetical protein